MITLDETQIATLAEGWEFEIDDVTTAVQMASQLSEMMPEFDLVMFVDTLDDIVAGVAEARAAGRIDPRFSASYAVYCYARVQAGLPLV